MFSFSMIGYEIITLQRVYSNATVKEDIVIDKIKNEGEHPDEKNLMVIAEKLTKKRDQRICKGLIELVKRCWNISPGSRPNAKEGSVFIHLI